MAKSVLSLKDEAVERLETAMREFPEYAGDTINDVLWGQGAESIKAGIQLLLPESGRTWRGKKKAAKKAAPFTQTNETLAVTVRTKNAYHYLYFPDDGSNTRKHVGNQQFMLGGALNRQEEIIDLCVARLVEKFER